MGSLWKVDDNQHPGFVIGKPFWMPFGNREGIGHIVVFCIVAKIAIVTMSKMLYDLFLELPGQIWKHKKNLF